MFLLRALLVRLLMPFVLLGVLFVGANVGVERVAERRAGSAAQRFLGLAAEPAVDVDAFPILVSAWRGRVREVVVRAAGVPLEHELTARAVTVRFREVTAVDGMIATVRRILAGDEEATLHVERGAVVAEIDEEALNAYLASKAERARVALREGRVTLSVSKRIAGGAHRIRASGRLEIVKGRLRFVPHRVTLDGLPAPALVRREVERAATFAVPVPPLPGGVRMDDIEVLDRHLRVAATLRDYDFRLADRRLPGDEKPAA